MSKLKVCIAFGTRPEAIKLAPVILRFDRHPDVEQRVLVSGQHRQLLDQVLELFGIQPARDLKVMQADQSLGALTARVLHEVEQDLAAYRPDWLIVQGDTTTALASALAAYYQRIPVAHVEAGLRTSDRLNPFPEEINRRFIGQIADLHFAPTERAQQNLLREGVNAATIHVTGNTGIDALLEIASRSRVAPLPACGTGTLGHLLQGLGRHLPFDAGRQRLLLVTGHRRESFGEELLNVCEALRTLVTRNPDVHVLYAVHPNPNVCTPVRRELEGLPRIHLTHALDYASFVYLMQCSFLILTDSGGIQEEAPSLGKPVLVLRSCTERLEAIEAGTAKLVGTDPDRIVGETERLLRDPALYTRMAQARNPYGDGRAAERIVHQLLQSGARESKVENELSEGASNGQTEPRCLTPAHIVS
jgi:UDP-N-acetylglucosamine 2-epimerase (non-hydrolysing)